ncbi:MAG: FHIPEP family type III secretion protein, partial [Vulcanimicrobiota bacterium]
MATGIQTRMRSVNRRTSTGLRQSILSVLDTRASSHDFGDACLLMLGIGLFGTLYNHLPPFAHLLGAGHFFQLSGADRSTVLVDHLHDPASISGLERVFSELTGHPVQVASQAGPFWWQFLLLTFSILMVYRAGAWLMRHPASWENPPPQLAARVGAGLLALGVGTLLTPQLGLLCWLLFGLGCLALFADLGLGSKTHSRLFGGLALLRLSLWGAVFQVGWDGPHWVTPAALTVGGLMLWLTRATGQSPIHRWVQVELYGLVWLWVAQGPHEGPLLVFLSGVAFLGLSALLRRRRLGVTTKVGCLLRSLSRIASLVGVACLPAAAWGYHHGLLPHPLWGALPLLLLMVSGSPWRATGLRQRKVALPDSLTGSQAAAVCLMSLPPEVSADLFRRMGPELVYQVTIEISKLPQICPRLRHQVVECVFGCDGLDALERLATKHPDLATDRLVDLVTDSGRVGSQPGLGPVKQKHLLLGLGLVLALIAQGGWNEPSFGGPEARAMVGYRARVLASDHYLVVTGVGLTSQQWDDLTRTLPRQPGQLLLSVPLEQGAAEQVGWAVLILGLLYTLCQWFHPQPEVAGSRVAACLLGGFGLCALTGIFWLPPAPFLLAGLAALGVAATTPQAVPSAPPVRSVRVTLLNEPAPPEPAPLPEPKPVKVARAADLLHVDEVTVEVGRGLLSLVDPKEGARLLERVRSIRATLAQELGIVVPGVRFRDDLLLPAKNMRLSLFGQEVGQIQLELDLLLAILPLHVPDLEGLPTTDPLFGLDALWIERDRQGMAERLGVPTQDAVSVAGTYLIESIRARADRLLTLDMVEALLTELAKTDPVVVTMARLRLDVLELQQILRGLLAERVSIRPLALILDQLLQMPEGLLVEAAVARLRVALASQITVSLAVAGKLRLLDLTGLVVDEQLLGQIREQFHQLELRGLLVDPEDRLRVRQALGDLPVLASNDLVASLVEIDLVSADQLEGFERED